MNQDSLAERHNATSGRHPVSKMCSKYQPMVSQLKIDMMHISKLYEVNLNICVRKILIEKLSQSN